MLGNIIDRRTQETCPDVDAVFEPSFHDNARYPDGTPIFPDCSTEAGYFLVTASYQTSVRDAIQRAETEWPFAITVYLYDPGLRPLG
jgi:hypothetical protein